MFYEIIFQYSTYQPTYFDAYPKLQAFKTRFEEIPSLKAYMASPGYIRLPCFSKLAKTQF